MMSTTRVIRMSLVLQEVAPEWRDDGFDLLPDLSYLVIKLVADRPGVLRLSTRHMALSSFTYICKLSFA